MESDNAEGMLAQADRDSKMAALKKAEMEAIDQIQREINDLWEKQYALDRQFEKVNKAETEAGDDETKLAKTTIDRAKLTADAEKVQEEIASKQGAFDKLMEAKWKREEAEYIEQQQRDMKDQKNNAMRRQRDLAFETQDM